MHFHRWSGMLFLVLLHHNVEKNSINCRIGGGGVAGDTNGDAVVVISDAEDDRRAGSGCRHRSRRRARPPFWVTKDYLLLQPQKLPK